MAVMEAKSGAEEHEYILGCGTELTLEKGIDAVED